ncbi:MAG: efflux RND transporter periplasmic adaptor subunit [Rhodospirillales bacterium]|jgi:RND family efflux transporter MFP subunit|nr:efflux RND transporter periplasmic adaptor subunit [Rhodospirillales bacterium]
MRRSAATFGFLALAPLLVGCDQQQAPPPETVRAIRAIEVGDAVSGQVRRFPGLIEAKESSELSFEVGGSVREVLVNQGDFVRGGQVLARLDDERFRLAVSAANADVDRARAYVAQTTADYQRHQRLLAQRAVSQVQFEVAQRNYDSARSQLEFAQAQLGLAQRDLRSTTLKAPFAGAIAVRQIEPFLEVRAGQTVFRLDAERGIEVAIGVPETTIAQLRLGMPATVTVASRAEAMAAQVTEIGTAAAAGNTFPVKLALLQPPPAIRPGMTAEASLVLGQDERGETYFVPLAAIAPGERPGDGFVFVYDAGTSTVRRTAVRAAGTLSSNEVAVSGLSRGQIIATAGVTFLVDGQKVRLLEAPAAPARTSP